MTIDPVLDLTARAGLATVLATAALHKVRDLDAFRSVVREYALLPNGSERLVAPGLAVLEIALAGALVWPPVRVEACVALGALLLAYTMAIGINLARGRRHIDCGCFGPAHRQALSGWMVWRNLVLLAAAVVAGWPVSPRPLEPLDFFTFVSGWLALALCWTAAARLLGQWDAVRALRSPT